MRSALSRCALRRAATLEDALAILRDEQPLPIAGATDVYVALNFGQPMPTRYLDINGLDELRTIAVRDGTLVLGALVTFTAVIRSPLVHKHLPMLVDAARLVGGVQIQNRGTLGGNIANASPAGDSLPVFAASDAVLVLQCAASTRRIPINDFYTGYRQTVMRPDELIFAIEIPPLSGDQYFRKVGTRAALAISKIVMAGVRDATPHIAFGSVAPTVVRARGTEKALASGATIDDAVRILATEISPIDDLRSTSAYRLLVAGNLLRHFWGK